LCAALDTPSHRQGSIALVIKTPLALSKFTALAVLLIASAPSVCAAATAPLSQPPQAHAELQRVAASASQPEASVLVRDAEHAADHAADAHHKAQALAQVAAPVAPVPELDTWALMLGGLGALVFITRRRLFA
jgi:hypothetical protein